MKRTPVSSIIYYGTPEFAVAPLAALCDAGWPVKAVVSAPDRPAGRGRKMRMPAVKHFALERNIEVLQPGQLDHPEFLKIIRAINPDLQIVVAFRKLPESVWRLPSLGTVNLHASLLPQYRGAAPINHAIINGEKQTGLTTFLINKNIDFGDILLQRELQIFDEDDFGSLHDRMMETGSDLVMDTVEVLASGNVHPQKQTNDHQLHSAPKLSRSFCRMNWNNTTTAIRNFVRGLSPVPGAWTTTNKGKVVKIFKVALEKDQVKESAEPGAVIFENDQMFVRCADGWLCVLEIQAEGRNRMSTPDFIRGLHKDQLFTFK